MSVLTKGPAITKVGATVLLAGALAIAGCKSKPPKELPPEPGAPATSTDTGQMGSGVATPGSQADFVQVMSGADTIYFELDRYDVDSQDQIALARQAQWLARYPAKRATIEGHADERGTREYNLALGDRRANAAKNYLAARGVAASRITTISYGSERPAATGSDDAAWAQNRRAVTVVLN